MKFKIQEAQSFSELLADWNRLLSRSATDVPFLTYQFQLAWWESFGQEIRLLALRDEGNELRGIAPLYREGKLLRLGGGTEVADYLDLIVARGHEEELWHRLLAHLCEEEGWETLELRCIPHSSPTREILPRLALSFDLELHEAREGVCPILELPSSWEGYLTMLSRKKRHELRRKLRRAKEVGDLSLSVARGGDDLALGLETFFDLHRRSHEDKHAFMDEAMEAFFRRLAGTMAPQGWVELATLWVKGSAVAAYFCFCYKGVIMVYNSGYAPDNYGDISPGIVLLALYIQDAIGRGVTRLDFLRGDERYKYDLGSQDTFIYQITLRRR